LQRLGVVIKQLEALVPLLGSGSDSGKDVLKALNMLSKHSPPGSTSPAAEDRSLKEAQMRNVQNQRMQQQLQAQQAQQGQGQQGGGMGAAMGAAA